MAKLHLVAVPLLAIAATAPAVAQEALTEAADPVMRGTVGETLTSTAEGRGAVTLNVDPDRVDRRLYIRIVAANWTPQFQPFGPDNVEVSVDGDAVQIATVNEVLGRPVSRSARDSTLARASSAPNIEGFGADDPERTGSEAGFPDESFATGEGTPEDDEARALEEVLLAPDTVTPRGSHSGGLLTDRVSRRARAVAFAVTFAGHVHEFEVALR